MFYLQVHNPYDVPLHFHLRGKVRNKRVTAAMWSIFANQTTATTTKAPGKKASKKKARSYPYSTIPVSHVMADHRKQAITAVASPSSSGISRPSAGPTSSPSRRPSMGYYSSESGGGIVSDSESTTTASKKSSKQADGRVTAVRKHLARSLVYESDEDLRTAPFLPVPPPAAVILAEFGLIRLVYVRPAVLNLTALAQLQGAMETPYLIDEASSSTGVEVAPRQLATLGPIVFVPPGPVKTNGGRNARIKATSDDNHNAYPSPVDDIYLSELYVLNNFTGLDKVNLRASVGKPVIGLSGLSVLSANGNENQDVQSCSLKNEPRVSVTTSSPASTWLYTATHTSSDDMFLVMLVNRGNVTGTVQNVLIDGVDCHSARAQRIEALADYCQMLPMPIPPRRAIQFKLPLWIFPSLCLSRQGDRSVVFSISGSANPPPASSSSGSSSGRSGAYVYSELDVELSLLTTFATEAQYQQSCKAYLRERAIEGWMKLGKEAFILLICTAVAVGLYMFMKLSVPMTALVDFIRPPVKRVNVVVSLDIADLGPSKKKTAKHASKASGGGGKTSSKGAATAAAPKAAPTKRPPVPPKPANAIVTNTTVIKERDVPSTDTATDPSPSSSEQSSPRPSEASSSATSSPRPMSARTAPADSRATSIDRADDLPINRPSSLDQPILVTSKRAKKLQRERKVSIVTPTSLDVPSADPVKPSLPIPAMPLSQPITQETVTTLRFSLSDYYPSAQTDLTAVAPVSTTPPTPDIAEILVTKEEPASIDPDINPTASVPEAGLKEVDEEEEEANVATLQTDEEEDIDARVNDVVGEVEEEEEEEEPDEEVEEEDEESAVESENESAHDGDDAASDVESDDVDDDEGEQLQEEDDDFMLFELEPLTLSDSDVAAPEPPAAAPFTPQRHLSMEAEDDYMVSPPPGFDPLTPATAAANLSGQLPRSLFASSLPPFPSVQSNTRAELSSDMSAYLPGLPSITQQRRNSSPQRTSPLGTNTYTASQGRPLYAPPFERGAHTLNLSPTLSGQYGYTPPPVPSPINALPDAFRSTLPRGFALDNPQQQQQQQQQRGGLSMSLEAPMLPPGGSFSVMPQVYNIMPPNEPAFGSSPANDLASPVVRRQVQRGTSESNRGQRQVPIYNLMQPPSAPVSDVYQPDPMSTYYTRASYSGQRSPAGAPSYNISSSYPPKISAPTGQSLTPGNSPRTQYGLTPGSDRRRPILIEPQSPRQTYTHPAAPRPAPSLNPPPSTSTFQQTSPRQAPTLDPYSPGGALSLLDSESAYLSMSGLHVNLDYLIDSDSDDQND